MPSSTHAGSRHTGRESARPNPITRQCVADAYLFAFNGSITSALSRLNETSHEPDPIDRVHLGCATTHLLHLDGQSEEALRTLEDDVFPLVDQFATNLREVIDYNRTIVATDCGDFPSQAEMERHNSLVDRRASVGFESGDPSKLLNADRAAANGKLYDALPIYTSAFYDAFNTYDWSAWKQAAGRLSGAVLQLGDVSQATFYACISEDDGVVDRIVRHLVARNDPDVIGIALKMLKRKANLQRHRLMAFKFVAGLDDAVPDRAADEWSSLCRSYRCQSNSGFRTKPMFDAAWKLSYAVAPALSRDAANLLAEDALNHPDWDYVPFRKQWIHRVLFETGVHHSESLAARVVDVVVPCAKPPLENDFEFAAHLLAKIYAQRPVLRDQIRNTLFPSGEVVSPHLARLGHRFDVEIPRDDFETYMGQAHGLLDSQISAGGISMGQDINVLLLIFALKDRLQQDQIDGIVGRMLDLIEHPRNANTNRSRMIHCTTLLIENVGLETGRRATQLYATYAADHRVDGHPLINAAEEEHPLNPFRMGSASGWPQEVRGEALIALGVAASQAEIVEGLDLESLFRAALDDPNPAVRRDACVAVNRAISVSCDLLRVVLIRAADPAIEVADVALQVLAYRSQDVADLALAGSALAVASTQAGHADPSVRAAAAKVIASIRRMPPSTLTPAENRQLDAVAERLATDVARSVRRNLIDTEV